MLLQYMRTNPDKLARGLGHHRLILATLDCIWCCVIGAYMNEDAFLEGQGLFLLLDLLQVGHLQEVLNAKKNISILLIYGSHQEILHTLCCIILKSFTNTS